jgi:hypothetical protein
MKRVNDPTDRSNSQEMATDLRTCAQCGAAVPDIAGPVHKYVPSAPDCWQLFGQIQADEAVRFGYPPAHRLVVDAYMAQHPGDGEDRPDRQCSRARR